MNKKTKMLVGVGVVAIAAYYFWNKSKKKSFVNAIAAPRGIARDNVKSSRPMNTSYAQQAVSSPITQEGSCETCYTALTTGRSMPSGCNCCRVSDTNIGRMVNCQSCVFNGRNCPV